MANHKAMFWEYDAGIEKVRCYLCPQFCVLGQGQLGLCRTRKNINRELITINYGEVTSIALDPMEKKPLYHFKPGTNILSLGTFGCNMRCSFCQNYTISQQKAPSESLNFDDLVRVLESVENQGNIGIAFTYNEPFMWYEYIYDTVKELKAKYPKLVVGLVTNGYINEPPLRKLLPFIDALNIDLKAFTNEYYRTICGAKIDPVLNTIEIASKSCHVEVTTLLVTGENDSLAEVEKIAQFISQTHKDIPLHLSRYYPMYKLNNPPTDINRMKEAKEIASKYLNYVYLGNVGDEANTYCPNCHALLIKRHYYDITCYLNEPVCPKCKEDLSIIL